MNQAPQGPPLSELRLHIAVVDFLRQHCRPSWIFFHVANGEIRDLRLAAKLRAMGLRPGVPDLTLIGPDGGARFIEFKTPSGRLSPEQLGFREHCIRHGIPYAVATSVDAAITALEQWDALVRRPDEVRA